ncbi:hypothetical protein ACFVT5_05950 [Streptomyces sp. NPDC058001]
MVANPAYPLVSAHPHLFGAAGTDHAWGPAEISGNIIRDQTASCTRY